MSGIQLRIGVMQFANEEAAARFYNDLESNSAKSPAVTHPEAGLGASAVQVGGPNNTSIYVLKKDTVATIAVYQPLYKSEVAQKAGLDLLPNIVKRIR